MRPRWTVPPARPELALRVLGAVIARHARCAGGLGQSPPAPSHCHAQVRSRAGPDHHRRCPRPRLDGIASIHAEELSAVNLRLRRRLRPPPSTQHTARTNVRESSNRQVSDSVHPFFRLRHRPDENQCIGSVTDGQDLWNDDQSRTRAGADEVSEISGHRPVVVSPPRESDDCGPQALEPQDH